MFDLGSGGGDKGGGGTNGTAFADGGVRSVSDDIIVLLLSE